MSIAVRMLLVFALLVGSTAPAYAQDRGHGSIYYSASGHRIGYARSMPDDANADHVAHAMCEGGQIDAQSLQAYSNKEAGVAATGAGPALSVVLNDCTRVIKFDSHANHRCGGFGFNADGTFSRGVRKRTRGNVENDLSAWQQRFVICNDDAPVSGFDRFLGALDSLAQALGGTSGQPQSQPQSGVTFTNTTAVAVSIGLKCANESAFQPFQVAANATQTFSASSWNASCSDYTVQITTSNNDGSQTQNDRAVQAGGSYSIVYNGDSLDLGSAPAPPPALVIVNDTASSVNFTLACQNQTPASLSVGPNATFTQVLACASGAMLSLETGANGNFTTKTYPVGNGQTRHIRYDTNLNLYTLSAP